MARVGTLIGRSAGPLRSDQTFLSAAPGRKDRGLLSFFNERVDGLSVDGELQDKPKTPWA